VRSVLTPFAHWDQFGTDGLPPDADGAGFAANADGTKAMVEMTTISVARTVVDLRRVGAKNARESDFIDPPYPSSDPLRTPRATTTTQR
jgi:hypothetical protein